MKKFIAVIFAVVMVVAILAAVYPSLHGIQTVRKPAAYGPKVNVHVSYPAVPGNSSVSTILQVYSSVPDAFGITGHPNLTIPGGDQSNNGYYVQILNATLTNNTSSLLLSPEFNNISGEWISAFSGYSGSDMPSLSVDAYRTVYSDGNVSIYSYYNNMPYNPLKINMQNSTDENQTVVSDWFNGTGVDVTAHSYILFSQNALNLNIQFPSQPSQVLHVSANSSGAVASSVFKPDQCTNFYYNETCYSTCNDVISVNYTDTQDMHSPVVLPILAVHLSNATSNGNSLIDISSSIVLFNDSISLNSANAFKSDSGQESSTMSTSPSFEHMANITSSSSTNETNAYTKSIAERLGTPANDTQNATTAIVGIANVTYEFTHYLRKTYEYVKEYEGIWSSNCEFFTVHLVKTTLVGVTKDGLGTEASIVDIASVNGIKIIAEDVPIEVNMIVHDLLEKASNGSIILNWTGSDTAYQASTIWADIYGYSNAGSVIKSISSALAYFSSSLELGLAISDALAAANGADADTSEAAVVADAGTMIAKAIGMSADILDLFSTISFVSGTNLASLGYGFSSSTGGPTGSSYSLAYYESQYPITFTADGNTYSFYAPTDYLNATSIVK